MRRLAFLLFASLLGALTVVTAGATPAQAQCPEGDGTIPQTPSRAFRVGAGSAVIYIDDRDFIDYDADDKSGGLWIYAESNGKNGLQRGGSTYVFNVARDAGVDTDVPRIKPVALPTGNTLFPNGAGGGDLEETAGSHDDCKDKGPGDSIIF